MTSLRFFAAAWVFLHHSLNVFGGPVSRLGYVGVAVFFVLSGFVLTWSGSSRDGATAFWRNRAARILPLHYATMAAAVVVPFPTGIDLRHGIQSVTLMQAWAGDGARDLGFNGPSWSLSAEAFFYLCFPFVVRIAERCPPRLLVYAVAGLLALQTDIAAGMPHTSAGEWMAYARPPLRIGEFVSGIILAQLVIRGADPAAWLRRLWLAVASAGVMTAVAADLANRGSLAMSNALFMPAIMLMLFALADAETRGTVAGWLVSRPLVRLGQWSFAFYLVHQLVIKCVAWGFRDGEAWFLPSSQVPVAAGLSLLVAAAACEYVEKPLERRLRAPRRHQGDLQLVREVAAGCERIVVPESPTSGVRPA